MSEPAFVPATPDQSESERKLVGKLLKMWEEGKEEKRKYTRMWPDNVNFYRSRQWPKREPWKASPVMNLVAQKVEAIIPILTDNRPRVDLYPSEPGYDDYVEATQNYQDWLWDKDDSDLTFEMGTRAVQIYSLAIYYTTWSHRLDRPTTELLDPECFVVAPKSRSIETARWAGHISKMTVAEVKSTWKNAKDVKLVPGDGLVEDPSPSGDSDFPTQMDVHLARIGDNVLEIQGGSLDGENEDDKELQVLQFWIKDPTVFEQQHTFGGKLWSIQRPLYPTLRHIVLAGKRVLVDQTHPYDHGQYPYTIQPCFPIQNEFWPVSLVELIISPQKVVNKLFGQILDNAGLTANPQWKVSRQANVDRDMLTGEPGLVIEYDEVPGAVVERIDGKPLPSYVLQTLQMAVGLINDITGVHSSAEGKKASGIQAGVAIESLQQAVETRLRLQVRHLERAVRQVGEQRLALCQQFVKKPRNVRVDDPESAGYTWLTLTPEMIQKAYEVRVVAGSTLPKSRDQLMRQAVELKKLNVLDEEGVMDYVSMPGKGKIIKRLRARAELQQQMAMRMGVMPRAGQ